MDSTTAVNMNIQRSKVVFPFIPSQISTKEREK